MEPSTDVPVSYIFTTEVQTSEVVVTPVQQPHEGGQIQTESAAVSFQPNNPTLAQVQGTLLEAQVQDGTGSIPTVQQAVYQTEGSGNVSKQALQTQVSDKSESLF